MDDSLSTLEEYDQAVQRKLWSLLGKAAADFCLGDSTSLPVEVAQELFRSILYTLRLYLDARGETLQALQVQDEDELYARAVAHLEEETEQTKALYAAVLRVTPPLGSVSLRDTLRNIGIGLQRYHCRRMAHVPPGEIDYQLCLPVEDGLPGVSYVREYLRRLWAESVVIGRFDCQDCLRLLKSRFPDYGELLINLYEPVLTRALGRVLMGETFKPPLLGDAPAGPFPSAFTKEELGAAAQTLADSLRLPAECRAYVLESARRLLPRLNVAARNNALAGLL